MKNLTIEQVASKIINAKTDKTKAKYDMIAMDLGKDKCLAIWDLVSKNRASEAKQEGTFTDSMFS